MEEFRGEAREVGVRGIERGRRGLAGATPTAGSAHVGLGVSSSSRKEGEGKNEHNSVGIRTDVRARRARFADGRRVEGLADVQAPVWAR